MRWLYHQAVTASTMLAITGEPVIAVAVAMASTIPDAIEGKPWFYKNQYQFRKQHRQISHWFVPYICIGILAAIIIVMTIPDSVNLKYILYQIKGGNIPIQTSIFYMATIAEIGVLGSLFHIIEDACCGSVPGVSLTGPRLGKTFFRVHTVKESKYVFIYCIISFVFVFFKY